MDITVTFSQAEATAVRDLLQGPDGADDGDGPEILISACSTLDNAWAKILERRADQDHDDALDREADARVLADEERRTVQHAERFARS